ncbi:hypothetical protein EYC80_003021 [Monilinia laxa]|uniref:C2H2-type domain-containing protein n=1 Tax=Monilinia laxa TaxID=61186 RepID=A0A5N6KCH6_MONLA|nr:hypothetical protein EYC80_003021 [Monilinia laxa]
MAAFANKSGMSFVPSSILESRKDLQEYHELEKEMHKKHKVVPDTPYICGVCGAKKKTHADLEKHFKTLHERERNKKLNRASSLKGAKRKRFLANAFPEEKVVRYREAATGVITPADQYKLDSELRRAGVAVNLVKSGSQAADRALMTFAETTWKKKGGSYDWLILLSDDTDFEPMLKDASLKRRVGTIVVGDEKYIGKGKLANAACAWMPWDIVQSGCIDKVAFENAFEYTVPNKQKKERIRQIRDIIGVDEQDGSGASYLSSSSSDENTDNEDILDDNISNQHDLDLASTSVSDSRPFSLPSSSLPSGSSSAEDTLESLASPGSSDLGLSEFPLECEDYWPLSNSYSDPLAALDSLMEGDPFHPNTSYFDFPGKSKSKSKSKSKPKSKQKQKQKQKQKSEPGSKKKEKKKSKEKGTSENK